jgi:nucleotide-binding universal stress UspA family protein
MYHVQLSSKYKELSGDKEIAFLYSPSSFYGQWHQQDVNEVFDDFVFSKRNISLEEARDYIEDSVIDDYMREVSEKDLKGAQKVLDTAGIKHSMVIKRGNIANEIITLANKEKFDLIVMGSKGRSGIVDTIMGSVAQRVSNTAKQAVLLIK